MTLPFVSALMATYNRYPDHARLVEEAVVCFLAQDYPADSCELLIWSDAFPQKLFCREPGVRVINSERFTSLGMKRNAMVAAAKGDLVMCWDDDDLYQPWRLSQAVAGIGNADYWKPNGNWLAMDGRLAPVYDHVRHNAGVFRKSAFWRVGGYPPLSQGEDLAMDRKLRELAWTEEVLDPKAFPTIYRWGVSPVHLSVNDYAAIGRRELIPGRYEVRGALHDPSLFDHRR